MYEDLAEINLEMLDCEEHPGPMSWIARSYLHRGDYAEAREWYERCLATAGEDIPKEAAVALHGLATIDVNVGEYDSAREKFQKALTMRQQIGDRAGEAATWHNLATIDVNVGDYDSARENFQKSLEIEQQIGNRAGEAATFHQLATIDVNVGEYDSAREKFQKALTMRQQIGDRAGEAATWHQLATIDLKVGEYDSAREKFQKALTMRQQIGDRAGEAVTLHQLATIDVNVGDYDSAREKFQKSLEINQQIGNRAIEAVTLSQLGFMAYQSGRVVEGIRLVALYFIISNSIGHTHAKTASNMLTQMAAQLSYTQEQLQAMLGEVIEAYKADRGRGLVEAAFPKS